VVAPRPVRRRPAEDLDEDGGDDVAPRRARAPRARAAVPAVDQGPDMDGDEDVAVDAGALDEEDE
jgi:hypothetical protein